MQLLERLQYHIRKLYEEQWGYTHAIGGVVEYVEDPKNDNQFRKFIKDSNYARCAFIKGKWYFWPAKHATHDDFVKSMGLYPYWNPWHKLEIQLKNGSLGLGFMILDDWEELLRKDIKEQGYVSKDTFNIIKSGTMLVLDLCKRYGLKLDTGDLFRLKKMLAYRKPAAYGAYEDTYDLDRSANNGKIARKQFKHRDKSLPKKDRQSRIGYKWPNDPDKLKLDDSILYGD